MIKNVNEKANEIKKHTFLPTSQTDNELLTDLIHKYQGQR